MRIRWLDDRTGHGLKPTWDVKFARIHTVLRMLMPDGKTRQDTLVLCISVTGEQYRKLCDEFGKENIPSNILGIEVIPLYPNAVLWTHRPPKGYEKGWPVSTYYACEIIPDEEIVTGTEEDAVG